MNFTVAAITFGLTFPAELPDKTFIATVVMASRNRFWPVWVGVGIGLNVQAALAVVAGRLLRLLPHTTVESIVAALFIGGAAYLIFVPERTEALKGEKLGEGGEGGEGIEGGPSKPAWKVLLTAFTVVALAEFGDITQILIANLSARYKDPWAVLVGSIVAFWLVAAIGAFAGKTITRFAPLAVVRRLSGLALLGFGIWTIVGLL